MLKYLHSKSGAQNIDGSEKHFFLRFFWLVGGYGILFMLGLGIFTDHFFSIMISTILYWMTFVAIITGRFIDVRFLNGKTDQGEPATLLHWRNYSLKVFAVAALLWLIAFFGHRLVIHLFLGL
jgi:hypothetical protein